MKPLLITLLLVIGGCSLFDLNSSSPESRTTLALTLQEGEKKALPPFNADLRFVKKTKESRCPIDVWCASAGEAAVLLELDPEGQPAESFTITWAWAEDQGLDEDGHVYKDTLGLRFTLVDLRPYPDTRVPEPGPSVVTLRVDRRP